MSSGLHDCWLTAPIRFSRVVVIIGSTQLMHGNGPGRIGLKLTQELRSRFLKQLADRRGVKFFLRNDAFRSDETDDFMVEILPAGHGDERRDLVHRVVQCLSDGHLVGLPLEYGYVVVGSACGQSPIFEVDSEQCSPIFLARTAAEAADFLTGLPERGRRLIRRCWPGSVILQANSKAVGGLIERLTAPARRALQSDVHSFRVTVSASAIVGEIGRFLSGPMMAPLVHNTVETADQLADCFEPAMIIDGGPVASVQKPTIIEWRDRDWSLEREGAVSQENLHRMSATVVVFVCTGNTCRSPMAEAVFRQLLAERAGCDPKDLAENGFVVASAGLAAGYGAPVSPESGHLMQERGLDLTGHESQPLTERLLTNADFVYTMTRGHRSAILAERPELQDRVQVLARDGSDISDPIGGGLDEYRRCLESMEQHLTAILSELPPVE